jgi:2-succinyl-5-enolpyruvyl-6-hydroxy-3-cyclohexene-1-carboxylate synthase
MDTYASLTRSFRMHPHHFFAELKWEGAGSYAQTWQDRNRINQQHHDRYVSQAAFSDLQVVQTVHAAIPTGASLQMGNSSVVRYFLLDNPRQDLKYYGNRGASGIDGCTSTAVGANAVGTGETWLVSGDVAFFYDSNAFWNDQPKTGLKVVVINNQGGGIFRIIPGPESSGVMERYFESHHQRTAQALVHDFGVDYHWANDPGSLSEGLNWLKQHDGPAVLEVFTPRTVNAEILKSYFSSLKHTSGE